MSNPNDINYSQSAVEEQRAIFTNRSAEFNVILRQLNPNTAEPISVINSLVSEGNDVMARYASVLSQSAQDIINIAELLRQRDIELSIDLD